MATVLVVDDSPSDRALVALVLGKAGHTILEASDGATALDVARREQPDLVLTDLVLPVMDGYELVRRLRSDADTASARIAMYSAHFAEDELERFARAERVQLVLTKPVPPAALLAQTERCLAEAPPASVLDPAGAVEEHLRLLSGKLLQKVSELEQSNREVRRLLAALVEAQEQERARIARDVHDDPIQVLTAALLRLSVLRRELSEPKQIAALDELENGLTSVVDVLRTLLFELHPPDVSSGLAPSLREALASAFGAGAVAWSVTGDADTKLDLSRRLAAFRVLQEAIANCRRHARASRVAVEIDDQGDGVMIRVSDDGVGFDVQGLRGESRPGIRHLGLVSMRERAELAGGRLTVESAPGNGTTVSLWLPASTSPCAPDGR